MREELDSLRHHAKNANKNMNERRDRSQKDNSILLIEQPVKSYN